MVKRFLRWLSRSVYPGILPVEGGCPGAERFLEDLWRDAPGRAALAHTAAAMGVLVAPLARGRLRLFSGLAPDEQERLFAGWLRSRVYPVRLLAQLVKGAALIATLRGEKARRSLIPHA